MDAIKTDMMVDLRYTMKSHFPDGTVKEGSTEELHFIYGVDRQVPTFEKAIEGKSVGDSVTVTIPSSEIYGEHDPELIREIPKAGLIKQRLKEGQFYRQMKKGSLVSFKILEVKDKTVVADFNKPMAGIKVFLDLEVMAMREADKDEIERAMETQVKKISGAASVL